jgi:hypothetical protein
MTEAALPVTPVQFPRVATSPNPGACPRIESLLRENPFGPFSRSFSQNMNKDMNNYSPQMIEKMDSKWLPLATASILGQAPGPLERKIFFSANGVGAV